MSSPAGIDGHLGKLTVHAPLQMPQIIGILLGRDHLNENGPMANDTAPWIPGRGISRILAQENNISDVIQFLSDRDSSPWANLVGFMPDKVEREDRR